MSLQSLINDLHADGHILVEQLVPHAPTLYSQFRASIASQVKTFLDAHPSYTRIYRECDGSFTLTSYLDPEKVILPSGPVNIRQLCDLVAPLLPPSPFPLCPAPYGEQNLTPEYQMDGCFEESIITVRGRLGPGHEESDARLIAVAIRSSGERLGKARYYLCYSVEDGKYLYHIGTKMGKKVKTILSPESPLSKALEIRERFRGFYDSLSASSNNEAISIIALLDELCEMLGGRV